MRTNLRKHFEAGHSRHLLIENDQVERILGFARRFDYVPGFFSVTGVLDVIEAKFHEKYGSYELSQRPIVVADEDFQSMFEARVKSHSLALLPNGAFSLTERSVYHHLRLGFSDGTSQISLHFLTVSHCLTRSMA